MYRIFLLFISIIILSNSFAQQSINLIPIDNSSSDTLRAQAHYFTFAQDSVGAVNMENNNSIKSISQDTIIPVEEQSNENISIFINHVLPAKNLNLLPIERNNVDLFLYWLIGLSALIAIGKLAFYKQFILSITGNFSNRNFAQLQHLGSTIRHPLNLILFITYIVAIALLITILSYNKIDFSIYTINGLIIQNIISVLFVFIISFITSRIFNYIFKLDGLIHGYYARVIQSNNIIAITISIGLWLTIFTGLQTGIIIISSILALLYLLKIYNLLIFNRTKNKYGLLHYIIYICTVEILPLIVATKLYFIKVLQF